MKKFTLIFVGLILAACASKHKATEIDTKVEDTSPVSPDGVIGVKDGNMVYQKKVMMNEQLRTLELDVYNLEAKVYGGPRYLDNRGLYGVLRDCRVELSEPKNGGDGKLLWTEKREYVTQENDFTSMGLDKKKIVGVSEEYLKDRLERFGGYRKVLQDRQEEYETKVKVCELELKRHKKNDNE
jgi:hypothetical protein